jgi:hypothetical protein
MMMPEVGERDVIEFITTLPTPVPVVICSAAGSAALAGIDSVVVKAIIRKPSDIDQFIATVSRESRDGVTASFLRHRRV